MDYPICSFSSFSSRRREIFLAATRDAVCAMSFTRFLVQYTTLCAAPLFQGNALCIQRLIIAAGKSDG